MARGNKRTVWYVNNKHSSWYVMACTRSNCGYGLDETE
jgi:hypothetical protein